jgi:heme exporter protein A
MPPRSDLEIHDLTKKFGRHAVLSHVSLSVPAGSYVALMGHNGAGKTTLLRHAAGLAVPTSGSVTVAGVDLRRAGPGLHRRIGFVSHDGLLYGDLTGRANLVFQARLFGLDDPEGAVEAIGETFRLDPVLDKPAAVLSRGNRQRLTLARALLHDPDVIFLDEPFTGLDDVSTQRLVGMLAQLHAQGRTLVMTTHDTARTTDGPTRLVVLERGKLVADEPLVPQAVSSTAAAVREEFDDLREPVTVGAVSRGAEPSRSASGPAGGSGSAPAPVVAPLTRLPGTSEPEPDDVVLTLPEVSLGPVPGRWRSAWLIAAKDLRVEARSRDVLGAGGLFALVVLVTASFTLPTGGSRETLATGTLWISLLFAVLLGIGRSMARESNDRAIEGLLLSPAPRESIFLGKAAAGLVMMVAIEVFVVPMFLVLMVGGDLGLSGFVPLVITVVLATLGLVIVATLFSGIAVASRLGESMLPILVMPVVIPLMIAAVEATRSAIAGDAGTSGINMLQWYGLLAGFALVVGLAAVATFSAVVEE